MAPEIIYGEPYNMSCDLWSLGVLFYQMIFGQFPFLAVTMPQLLQLIKDGLANDKFIIEGKAINPHIENLIRGLLKRYPSERLTWVQVYEHPFFE